MEKIELIDGPKRVVELTAQDVIDLYKSCARYIEDLENVFGDKTGDSVRIRALKKALFNLL